jgi:hypothetical protein
MNRLQIHFVCFLAIFLSSCGVVFAQSSSTSLQGTVTDSTGAAIEGASVSLINAALKAERSMTTGSQGDYRFSSLAPGTYTLRVSASGFAKYEQTGLQLLVNTPATVNVELKVGGGLETVTVTGEAPALNMVDASLGNSFGETQVKQLPIDGRNVPDLLSLQPGVAFTGNRPDMEDPKYKDQDTRSGAVNGARSDQSNITLDGVDVNDQNSGYAFTSVLPITPDSVQEFRVTTSNYNADSGVGSGAQVALVTKSGTNVFHGSLYEFHRNTATSANDYLIKQAEFADGDPNKPLKLIRNVFGASLGGPIKKDRLFFFVNYEGTRRREEESALRTIASPSLRDGVLIYQCANGTTDCPNATPVQGNSGTTYTAHPGFFALSPTQITNLDPLGLGPSSVSLNYFSQTYGTLVGNDNTVGDGFNYVGFRFRAPVSNDDNTFISRIDGRCKAHAVLAWRAPQSLQSAGAFLAGNSSRADGCRSQQRNCCRLHRSTESDEN